ncbi:MAG: hypothetical protein MK165_19275 [Pirellulaceae bacterium]|nr:hypothetical protein [Pirellulaceae bacterium]
MIRKPRVQTAGGRGPSATLLRWATPYQGKQQLLARQVLLTGPQQQIRFSATRPALDSIPRLRHPAIQAAHVAPPPARQLAEKQSCHATTAIRSNLEFSISKSRVPKNIMRPLAQAEQTTTGS